ncbi:UAA transporter, partial [Scleroderma yunnanense]
LERVTSSYPYSGVLLTFFQFIVVFLYGLPKQFTFTQSKTVQANGVSNSHKASTATVVTRRTWLPRLRKRRVPLLPYLIQVALFFALSTLNNAAFAYDIPMTVHIIFRSGGMIVNMVLGWLLVKKRYTYRQTISVLVVTIGIVMTTLSASKPTSTTPKSHSVATSLYAQGIAILSLALLLSGFLGIVQDWVFTHYIKPTDAQAASGPHALPSWQENMFFLHALALPLFYFSKDGIISELSRMRASSPISLSSMPLITQPYMPSCVSSVPLIFVHLFANTITQLICVIGVNRLTGRVSSLSVTLILSVRKAVSLLLSVAVYGGQANIQMWVGAALVFLGTVGYSTGSQSKRTTQSKDKED